MKRLTARTETGHAYLVNVKPDEQEVDSPHKNTLQCILDCFERLAAYEDTGLEPEVCADYKAFEDEAISKGITFNRIVELMEADKDGLCVVLPCKVGDTVYRNVTLMNGDTKTVEGTLIEYAVNRNGEEFYFSEPSRYHDIWCDIANLGKTVFLTRAEAEAALVKEAEHE